MRFPLFETNTPFIPRHPGEGRGLCTINQRAVRTWIPAFAGMTAVIKNALLALLALVLFPTLATAQTSIRDVFYEQMVRCWNVNAEAGEICSTPIMVQFKLNPDGSLKGEPKIAPSSQPHLKKPGCPQMAKEALDAVKRCTPLHGLPPEQYEQWKEVEMVFDPKEMF